MSSVDRCVCIMILTLKLATMVSGSPTVSVLINNNPAVLGTLSASAVSSMVLSTGTMTIHFDSAFHAYSVIVNGSEVLQGATGSSFYVDSAGNNGMSVDTVKVLRLRPDLAEVALLDTIGSPLRHELHYVVRQGVTGFYAYHVLSVAPGASPSISEVRFISRWNRCGFT